ncbi:HPP family protein [Daejeonella sp. JGW-45]|uniref:HPP family protein n=1 Tax=Daejeonella sp. JGW-45 TaxID=3034148 RepID=UPI0023EE1935|nr:HPP family protein [Daejeonella sp. JGW-45]
MDFSRFFLWDRNNWIYKQYFPKTLHPPGGATALIANIGSEQIKALGYLFVLSPVLTGVRSCLW